MGGSGQLGAEIRRAWTECSIVAPSSSAVDVENHAAVERAFDEAAPEVVINCTAFHHVDRCETQAERAFAVNALAVDRMARSCRERGLTFITFSTDYVFDGEKTAPYVESDAPNPINAYGVSKLAGELLVGLLEMKAFVVRVCGLYGLRVSSSKGYTFIDRIIEQARSDEPLRIVNDQVTSPSYAAHVAVALRSLLETQRYGLYHLVNTGAVSWYDFACEALRQARVSHRVEPIASTDLHAAARRPRYSALENAGAGALGIRMPDWREGIASYLADKAQFS